MNRASWVKTLAILWLALAVGHPQSAGAAENMLKGKVVDSETQKPIGEVVVKFHEKGQPGTVFYTAETSNDEEDRGEYLGWVDRQMATFGVRYFHDDYVSDSRDRVLNNVHEKDLDTWALVRFDSVKDNAPLMAEALGAVIRYSVGLKEFAPGELKNAQIMLDNLKKADSIVYSRVIGDQPSIAEQLVTVGLIW